MNGRAVLGMGSKSQVARKNKHFRDRREEIEDAQRIGIQKVQDMLAEDNKLTNRHLARHTHTGHHLEGVHCRRDLC